MYLPRVTEKYLWCLPRTIKAREARNAPYIQNRSIALKQYSKRLSNKRILLISCFPFPRLYNVHMNRFIAREYQSTYVQPLPFKPFNSLLLGRQINAI